MYLRPFSYLIILIYLVVSFFPSEAFSSEALEDKCHEPLRDCTLNVPQEKDDISRFFGTTTPLSDFQQLEKKANEGDLDTQYELAISLTFGSYNNQVIKVDKPRAQEILRGIVALGETKYLADALGDIGVYADVYENNQEKAKEYYLKSGIHALKNYFRDDKRKKEAIYVHFKHYFLHVVEKEDDPKFYADFYEELWTNFFKPDNIWHIHISWKNYFEAIRKPLIYENK